MTLKSITVSKKRLSLECQHLVMFSDVHYQKVLRDLKQLKRETIPRDTLSINNKASCLSDIHFTNLLSVLNFSQHFNNIPCVSFWVAPNGVCFYKSILFEIKRDLHYDVMMLRRWVAYYPKGFLNMFKDWALANIVEGWYYETLILNTFHGRIWDDEVAAAVMWNLKSPLLIQHLISNMYSTALINLILSSLTVIL